MFNSKLVTCVKVGGAILRENNDLVYLPFGSEYSILLKNLHSTRAKVKVFVDGTDATDGVELVLNCGMLDNSVELTRFILNGNLTSGNRFKFIERTNAIEEFRGIKAEDGLIRIEWEFERVQPSIQKFPMNPININPWQKFDPYRPYIGDPHIQPGPGDSVNPMYRATCSSQNINYSANVQSSTGITVPGSVSNQEFVTALGFETDGERHTMIIKLVGENRSGSPVSIPITVKTKLKCQTCGKTGSPGDNFCSVCGTSLNIV